MILDDLHRLALSYILTMRDDGELSGWEIRFLRDILSKPPGYVLTEKQAAKIEEILSPRPARSLFRPSADYDPSDYDRYDYGAIDDIH